MNKVQMRLRRLAASVVALGVLSPLASAQKMEYPQSKKVEHVDTYFGVKVADPYRWLEEETPARDGARGSRSRTRSPSAYLEKIPYRAQLKDTADEALQLRALSARPTGSGEYYFFTKNDGLQNQTVALHAEGSRRRARGAARPEQVLGRGHDTARRASRRRVTRSTPPTARRRAGRTGSDCFVMEVATKKQLPDALNWVKVSGHGVAGRRLLLQPLSTRRRRARS